MNKSTLLWLCITTALTLYSQTHLYAPWRSSGEHLIEKETCFFCREIKAQQDDKFLILSRNTFIVQLNPKPYSRGSMLIYPIRHIADISQLEPIEYCDMFLIAKQVMEYLKIKLHVESFSIGMNLGPYACGSIPDHLHLHIVPRYPKESNGFLETCCNTKLVQEDLICLYKNLKSGLIRR